MKTFAERFWSKVEKKGPDECWPWLARRNDDGYGEIGLLGKKVRAHRACAEMNGMEIDDCVVRHSCDNPGCVNPAHLLVGTQADNVRDMYDRGRDVCHERSVTHCPRGHEYTAANVYRHPTKGGRSCRTCHREKSREYERNLRRRVIAERMICV